MRWEGRGVHFHLNQVTSKSSSVFDENEPLRDKFGTRILCKDKIQISLQIY